MDDILTLISKGESETLEFKKSTASMREAIETVCSFANHKGGSLIFGVDDDGIIIGQQVSDDTLKNIANSIKLNTEPKLYPRIEEIRLKGKSCVIVTVEESPLKPHSAYGRAFTRMGTTTQRLDRDQYEHLLMQRYNGYGFDYQIQEDAVLEDIDEPAVFDFLERANSLRNLNENTFLPLESVLEKLELMRKGKLTKAALLLFGKNPHKFFANHYEIKCGYFPSDNGYDELINDKEYSRNIIENFNFSYGFLMDILKKSATKKGVHRSEVWELPIDVIRESLVNMIVHRDYRQDIKSTVEVRPSLIRFYNPGHLFAPTITVERLKTVHSSRPGNKLIAKIFYLMGLFENWGGGTLKIINETIKAGKSSPEFFYEGGMFRLELYR
ncbi:MAG TPA: RNA-binding domain-containing protein [Candidatus Deferrimicrobium sp.]|nr:RNA-binding domain-containing protein [Candidatus Deferrimicrobium sp.]